MCKSLKSVFVLPNYYNFSPSLFTETKNTVLSFNRITRLESTGFPPNCDYFSFGLLSELDTLSWVNIDNTGTREVVEFGAWQAKYRIKWTVIGDNSGNRMNFVRPFNSTTGYEPWDIKGNDIKFCGNSGEFTVPGWYNNFAIRSEKKDIQLKLEIIAEDYDNNPFFNGNESKFCLIRKDGTSQHVFTLNPLGTVYKSQINRVIEPEFIGYYNQVQNEFYSRERTFSIC